MSRRNISALKMFDTFGKVSRRLDDWLPMVTWLGKVAATVVGYVTYANIEWIPQIGQI